MNFVSGYALIVIHQNINVIIVYVIGAGNVLMIVIMNVFVTFVKILNMIVYVYVLYVIQNLVNINVQDVMIHRGY